MPYIKPTRDNDPKSLAGLNQFKEDESPDHAAADTKAVLRNHGGDARITEQAAYDHETKTK